MKRTIISLSLITLFVFGVVFFDLFFMTRYVGALNDRMDLLEHASSREEQIERALDLGEFFKEHKFWANRLIPTDRMEDMETLLHKLNAYIETEDVHEVEATIAELRSRVNLLYSTDPYHWYHPTRFRIE